MGISKPKIIIIDDLLKENDPPMIKLKEVYDDVQLIKKSSKATNIILENIDKKMIVLLDIKLSTSEPDGHQVLDDIHKISSLIPVIIWSALIEKSEEFSDFINNKAFAFLSRPTSTKKIIEKVKEAEEWLNLQAASALEEWIHLHPEDAKNKPYIISRDGRKRTLKEILDEIRRRTPEGIELDKQLAMLTIDLLARNKVSLQEPKK